jgi:uncharacterized membrane protein YeaQ/YmgE (transglycosylase-associated protein family)
MIMTGITSALLVGVGIGALCRLVGPSRQRMGTVTTVLIVAVAALLGTVVARVTGIMGTPGIS